MIYAILLACVPNGQLYNIYGDGIIKSGKSGCKKGRDFRFDYRNAAVFKTLSKEEPVYRIEFLCLRKGIKPEEITTFKDIPVHTWID